MKRSSIILLTAMLTVPMLVQQAEATAENVKSGALTCDVSAGLDVIVGTQKQMSCLFTPSRPGPQEAYVGTIEKFGLDVGSTPGEQLIWEAYAPATRQFGVFSGDYTGASGKDMRNGTVHNALKGGADRTVTLQPLSVATDGVNVAAGVTELRLRPAR